MGGTVAIWKGKCFIRTETSWWCLTEAELGRAGIWLAETVQMGQQESIGFGAADGWIASTVLCPFVWGDVLSLCGFGLPLANGRWSPWPGMTLCILKLVAVSFAGWVYHLLSEEDMEILLILVCHLKLRENPIILSLGGGREGCTPDWWYLGCLLERA